MIDVIAHQQIGATVVGELTRRDQAGIGPIRTEIDSLQLVVGTDPPIVEVMIH
jgi:hypothetical protein